MAVRSSPRRLILASVLRPKRKTDVGLETYECGEETIGNAWIQFDIRYYTVALVYVIFAVEIAFLFPWALVLKNAVADAAPKTKGPIDAKPQAQRPRRIR